MAMIPPELLAIQQKWMTRGCPAGHKLLCLNPGMKNPGRVVDVEVIVLANHVDAAG